MVSLSETHAHQQGASAAGARSNSLRATSRAHILFAVKPGHGQERALLVLQWMARRDGLGCAILNRLLARLVVAWLGRPGR
jgi:hypothetical protein